MIAGLPWESWLLLGVAVGLGLTIELLFYRAQRRARRRRADGASASPDDGPAAGDGRAGSPAAGTRDEPGDAP